MGIMVKKTIAVIMVISMILLSTHFWGRESNVSASIPKIYSSEIWDGTGAAVVVVNSISADRFINLTYENEEVDNINYSVGKQDENTVIIFKEDYLQSLNLQNGSNRFMAKFIGREDSPLKACILLEGERELVLDRTLNAEVSKVTLKKSVSEEIDIEEENYSVTTTEDKIIINFGADYLQTISGNQVFLVYVVKDTLVWLEVLKDDAVGLPIKSENPIIVSPTIATEEAKVTNYPTGTKEPVVTMVSTESDEPIMTILPNKSEEPIKTMKPEKSDIPVITSLPVTSIVPLLKMGDADGNGIVQLRDAQLVLKAALKIVILNVDAEIRADIIQDRIITLEDAQKILRIALKIE